MLLGGHKKGCTFAAAFETQKHTFSGEKMITQIS